MVRVPGVAGAVVAVLLALPSGCDPGRAPVVQSRRPVVLYGEMEVIPNIEPPTRLDLVMRSANRAARRRCADMGGLWSMAGASESIPVCKDVDY